MPIYLYRLSEDAEVQGCPCCREGFEQVQRMSDAPLSACTQCGAQVVRVIQVPMLGNIDNKSVGPSDKTLQQAGFTKFKRNGKGNYEKLFGSGPSRIGE